MYEFHHDALKIVVSLKVSISVTKHETQKRIQVQNYAFFRSSLGALVAPTPLLANRENRTRKALLDLSIIRSTFM